LSCLSGPQPNSNGKWQENKEEQEWGEVGSGDFQRKILARRSAVEEGIC
jgi:hypothetical protein